MMHFCEVHIPFKYALILTWWLFGAFQMSGALSAQNSAIDSLDQLLKNPSLQIDERYRLLTEICDRCIDQDPQRGLDYDKQLLELGTMLSNDEMLGMSWCFMGYHYAYSGPEFDSVAMDCFRKSLPLLEKTTKVKEAGNVLYNLGFNCRNQQKFWQALSYFEKSSDKFASIKDTTRLLRTNIQLGDCFSRLEMYNESLKVHFNNLSFLQGIDDKAQYAKILALIAHDYGMLRQFEKAIQYFESSNVICREQNLTSVLADNLMQLGNIYSKLNKDYSFVLPFYAEARALYTNSTLESNRASVDVNEAIYRMGKGEYTFPAKVLPEVLNLFEKIDAKNQMSDIYVSLGDLFKDRADSAFIQDGISLKKSYQLSISYYHRAIELAHEIGAFRQEVDALRNLSTVYERTGELKLALENFKKSVIINDSINSLANQDELLRNEYTYFQRKRELEVDQERAELARITAAEINKQQQQRNVFAIIGGLILVSAIGGYRLIQNRRRAEKQRIEAEFQLVVRDTEMKALRAQMNPHFIFNSLNSISGYIARNDLKLADDYLTKFARLMRMVLENSEHKQISLADDLKALELYTKLEAMRLPKPLKVHFVVDPEIDQQETLIPPLILQPFVENSIWHGLSKADYEGEILIAIKKDKDMLCCSVQDNGVGISSQVQNSERGNKSMGMKITQARLDALHHAKQSNASVRISSLKQGTLVEVLLPLVTRF